MVGRMDESTSRAMKRRVVRETECRHLVKEFSENIRREKSTDRGKVKRRKRTPLFFKEKCQGNKRKKSIEDGKCNENG